MCSCYCCVCYCYNYSSYYYSDYYLKHEKLLLPPQQKKNVNMVITTIYMCMQAFVHILQNKRSFFHLYRFAFLLHIFLRFLLVAVADKHYSATKCKLNSLPYHSQRENKQHSSFSISFYTACPVSGFINPTQNRGFIVFFFFQWPPIQQKKISLRVWLF